MKFRLLVILTFLLSLAAHADGTAVVDAQVVERPGLNAAPEVKTSAASTVADKRTCNDPLTVLINKSEDESTHQAEFLTYSMQVTANTEEQTYKYEVIPTEEKIAAGEALEVESVLVAKELIERLRDEDFSRQHENLKKLLNANTDKDFQKLLFGEGGTIDQFRGLIEVGRDATDLNFMDQGRIKRSLGVTDKKLIEKEIFATGFLKTAGNKLVKIEDVLKSGVKFDPVVGRASLVKATAFSLLKEAVSKVESVEDQEKLAFLDEITSAGCLIECNFSGNIGDSLAELVKLTAYEHSPLVGVFCVLQEFSQLCNGTGEVPQKLKEQLEKYKDEIPEGYDCRKDPKAERAPTATDVAEGDGAKEDEAPSKIVEGVEILVERKSYDKEDKWIRYKAKLDGEKAEEVRSKGKFFWVCQKEGEGDSEDDEGDKDDKDEKDDKGDKDDKESKCKDINGASSVTYEDLKEDEDFEVQVMFKTEKDGDELVAPVSFRVTYECDTEDEDCEEEEEEEDKKRYTWEDFMQPDGIPDNWTPPTRAQPHILPPRRGMTITPAVP